MRLSQSIFFLKLNTKLKTKKFSDEVYWTFTFIMQPLTDVSCTFCFLLLLLFFLHNFLVG